MHVAHVKSPIEIDCTTEMSFLYRYRSVFARVHRRRKDLVRRGGSRCLFNASHAANEI